MFYRIIAIILSFLVPMGTASAADPEPPSILQDWIGFAADQVIGYVLSRYTSLGEYSWAISAGQLALSEGWQAYEYYRQGGGTMTSEEYFASRDFYRSVTGTIRICTPDYSDIVIGIGTLTVTSSPDSGSSICSKFVGAQDGTNFTRSLSYISTNYVITSNESDYVYFYYGSGPQPYTHTNSLRIEGTNEDFSGTFVGIYYPSYTPSNTLYIDLGYLKKTTWSPSSFYEFPANVCRKYSDTSYLVPPEKTGTLFPGYVNPAGRGKNLIIPKSNAAIIDNFLDTFPDIDFSSLQSSIDSFNTIIEERYPDFDDFVPLPDAESGADSGLIFPPNLPVVQFPDVDFPDVSLPAGVIRGAGFWFDILEDAFTSSGFMPFAIAIVIIAFFFFILG